MRWTTLLPALILGLVEGATEFIPVSSTGHLILVQNLLGFMGKKENAFAIFIQLGAILAVVWLYRKKILRLVLNWKTLPESRGLLINLFIGTLPAVIIGLPTEGWIETHFFKPFPVSLALIFGGIAILLVERLSKHPDVENMDYIPAKRAFGVGVIQVLSILFPGVSRSGATIMGGMALGLSRKAATEFSFFLAMPAMFGASLVKMISSHEVIAVTDVPVFAVGFGVSFVSALLVIRGLLAFVSKNSFAPFAYYRILLGAVILALALSGSAAAQEFKTGKDIVEAGFNYLRDKTSYAAVEMVIHRPDWERRMTINAWTKGQDESLIKILAPPKDKGNGTLKKGREMWIYNPKVNRVIKLPPSMMSQSWMGSDFSNNDLAKTDSLIKDYTHNIIGTETHDGKTVYSIASMPKPRAPVIWGMLKLKIREDLVFLRQEFFDEELKPVKIMTGTQIQMLGGKMFPKIWKMEKADVPEEYTVLDYQAVAFNVSLDKNLLSVSGLKTPLP